MTFAKKICALILSTAICTAGLTACGNIDTSEILDSLNGGASVTDETNTDNITDNDNTDIDDNAGNNANAGDSVPSEDTVEKVQTYSSYEKLYTDYSSVQKADGIEQVTTTILLGDSATSIDGNGAIYSNGTLTISEEGVYHISGTLTDGQIYVNVDKNVRLIFDGVSITNSNGAPVAIFGKKKKVITLAEGSVNTLTDGSVYSEDTNGYYSVDNDEPNSALFSKKSLTINGSGTLNVNASYNNGIGCKDALYLLGGNIKVNASNGHGIKGNDNVIIDGATIEVTSAKDGIKTDALNDDETAPTLDEDNEGYYLGNVIVKSGSVLVTSLQDGIQADNYLIVTDGVITLETGGGSNITPTDDSESAKGLKGGVGVYVTGQVNCDCSDDAIHSDGTVLIGSKADVVLASGDDAIHADGALTVTGEDTVVKITKSVEGIEGAQIIIEGGDITVYASDDGINASDGSGADNNVSSLYYLQSGGSVYVNAQGDGLDSNGTATLNGGTLIIEGSTNSGNGAIDTNGGFTVNGGTLIASGARGMNETPLNSSSQCAVVANVNAPTFAIIELKDADGKTVVTHKLSKTAQAIIISHESLVKGETFSLYSGNSLVKEFTLTSTITNLSSSNNSPFPDGNQNGRPVNRP